MIIGVGVDIVQIKRIEKLITKYGERFFQRILSNQELEKLKTLHQEKQINFIAKRFAAKESIAKAFGSGIAEKLKFKDMSIVNDTKGKPCVIFSDKLLLQQNIKIDVSLSDDYPVAIAFAVLSINKNINN